MERQIIQELLILSLSGTALGFLFLLLRPLTKKVFSWKWHYYLWLVVLLRLLAPVHIDAGLFPEVPRWGEVQLQESGAGQSRSGDRAAASGQDQALEYETASGQDQASEYETASGQDQALEYEAASGQTGDRIQTVLHGLALIWIFGAALALILRIYHYRKFVCHVKADCVRVETDEIQKLANTLGQKFHIKKWLWIYESSLVASPVLIGIRRPFIVLPKGTVEAEDAELVLRHEFTHLKRHDLWYKWLYQLALCVHWFNPFLHVFGKYLDRDCELSCDEAVIAPLSEEERRSYGNLLLDTAERQSRIHRSVLSATLSEGKENLRQRLQSILSFRKRGIAAAGLSALIFAGAAALAACAPAMRQDAETDSAVSKEEGSQGFFADLVDGLMGGSWRESVLKEPFHISDSEDAWRVYEDEELLAGDDVDGVWRAYFYSGGQGVRAESFAFCGSDSILIAQAEEPVEITVHSSWQLLSGSFKLVRVGPDGNVETLTESGEEDDLKLQLETGRNVIKMVGREARLEQLQISFDGLGSRKLAHVFYTENDEEAALLLEHIREGTADKEDFLYYLEWLDEDTIDAVFQELLTQGESFSGSELQEVFAYADAQSAGGILAAAIQDGTQPPLPAREIVDLMPYLEEDTVLELVQELDGEEFTFEVLRELLYYLDEENCETCLNLYLDMGNTLTDRQYGEIEYFLSGSARQRLDERLNIASGDKE